MRLHSKSIFLEISVPIAVLLIILFWSPWLPKTINPGRLPDGTCEFGDPNTKWVPFGRSYKTCYGDTYYMTPWAFRIRLVEGHPYTAIILE